MSLIVAGAGPGNPKLLTYETVEKIKTADIAAGFDRIIEDIKNIRKNVIKLNRINEITELPIKEKEVLILASGDPCFFGITQYLKNKGIKIDKILPGISSMQYLMNAIQKQWQNVQFYSLHGRAADFSSMKKNKEFFILTDKTNNPDFISQELKKHNFSGKIYIGYNLSYEDESIEIYNIGDKIKVKSFLNTVMVENEKY